jgi:hypothetical protein
MANPGFGALRCLDRASCKYLIWIQIPDERFNQLLTEVSAGHWPDSINVGFSNEEDEEGALVDGVFDDVAIPAEWLFVKSYGISIKMPDRL